MCYSAEVSFGTWAFGMLCTAVLYAQGKFFLFPFMVTQMQLVEGLRWIEALDERVLSILGKLVLYAQPVAAFYDAKQTSFIVPYIVIQGLTELLYGSRDLRFVVADDGHFEWKWSFDAVSVQALPYWIGLFAGASFLLPRWLSIFTMSMFAYFYIHHNQYSTYGSLWCVWVNLLWVYYILR
jgi:hypothetical protein